MWKCQLSTPPSAFHDSRPVARPSRFARYRSFCAASSLRRPMNTSSFDSRPRLPNTFARHDTSLVPGEVSHRGRRGGNTSFPRDTPNGHIFPGGTEFVDSNSFYRAPADQRSRHTAAFTPPSSRHLDRMSGEFTSIPAPLKDRYMDAPHPSVRADEVPPLAYTQGGHHHKISIDRDVRFRDEPMYSRSFGMMTGNAAGGVRTAGREFVGDSPSMASLRSERPVPTAWRSETPRSEGYADQNIRLVEYAPSSHVPYGAFASEHDNSRPRHDSSGLSYALSEGPDERIIRYDGVPAIEPILQGSFPHGREAVSYGSEAQFRGGAFGESRDRYVVGYLSDESYPDAYHHGMSARTIGNDRGVPAHGAVRVTREQESNGYPPTHHSYEELNDPRYPMPADPRRLDNHTEYPSNLEISSQRMRRDGFRDWGSDYAPGSNQDRFIRSRDDTGRWDERGDPILVPYREHYQTMRSYDPSRGYQSRDSERECDRVNAIRSSGDREGGAASGDISRKRGREESTSLDFGREFESPYSRPAKEGTWSTSRPFSFSSPGPYKPYRPK